MKLLHVITSLSSGGAERALYNLLAGGLAGRFDCHVVSLSDKGTYGERIRALRVPVHALGMRPGLPTPGAILRLRMLVREIQPNIIQGWMDHGNLAAWLAQKVAPGQPALVWNIRHSLYGLAGEKRMTWQVIRANRLLSYVPQAILYNSRLSRQKHEAFGFHSASGQVIPNGFDLGRFAPDSGGGRAMRGALGIPEEAVVVGHVARFHPMKDHARFVRAAVRLAETVDDLHILLSGRGVDPVNEALTVLVPDSLRPRFHWLGERDDVPDLMRTMDVFCQSSWSEAFPNVLGEAMATGVPCVATDVGDTVRIVADTGITVPPEDDDALLGGLRHMLDKSSEERAALGRAARARIEADFGMGAVVKQYISLYENSTAQ